MNRNEYLSRLNANLRNIPPQEINNVMQYYFEYFEEAGIQNEQIVIAELGAPEQLAGRICEDYMTRRMGSGNAAVRMKEKASDIWLILLAICGSPVWFPLGLALIIIIAACLLAIVIVVLSLAVASAAVMFSGIFATFVGIVTLFKHVPTGIFVTGTGLFCTGIGLLLLIGTVQLIRLIKKGVMSAAKLRLRKKTI